MRIEYTALVHLLLALLALVLLAAPASAQLPDRKSGEKALQIQRAAAEPWKSAPLSAETIQKFKAEQSCIAEIMLDAEMSPDADYTLIDDMGFLSDTIYSYGLESHLAKAHRGRAGQSITILEKRTKRAMPQGTLRKALLGHARALRLLLAAPSQSACSMLQIWQAGGYTENSYTEALQSADPFFSWYERLDDSLSSIEKGYIALERMRPAFSDNTLYRFAMPVNYPLLLKTEKEIEQ